MPYDAKCFELANYFLEDTDALPEDVEELAQAFQDAVETKLEELQK